MIYHPCLNDDGGQVTIPHPHTPSPQATWGDAKAEAIVIPQGSMPEALNGLPLITWANAPKSTAAWCALAEQHTIVEPAFTPPPYKHPAAGVVTIEPDGRIWIVAPTKAYGGYKASFPKGRVEKGLSLQASAIKEAFEESGLQVQLTGFLIDTPRSTTYTRYYLARRIGGNPSDMGWESQAVLLLPQSRLLNYLTNANDLPIVQKLASL